MSFTSEFRDFISKGNVIDLAVGVVIGAAFGKIVDSLVGDILMPPLGLVIGGVDFKDLKIVLSRASVDAAGVVTNAVSINYGSFIQAAITFLIIAMAVFAFIVKPINAIRKKNAAKAQADQPSGPPPLSKEEMLLTEIRDLLKK